MNRRIGSYTNPTLSDPQVFNPAEREGVTQLLAGARQAQGEALTQLSKAGKALKFGGRVLGPAAGYPVETDVHSLLLRELRGRYRQ